LEICTNDLISHANSLTLLQPFIALDDLRGHLLGLHTWAETCLRLHLVEARCPPRVWPAGGLLVQAEQPGEAGPPTTSASASAAPRSQKNS
jgi:hypothetical protein